MKQILDAKYERANLKSIVNECTRLKEQEKLSLEMLLHKYEPLFDGTLGTWSQEPYHIENI
jgi:hypothetical protein